MSTTSGAAWVSVATGVASVATLPAAIYATRFSESYDLLHAGLVIPFGAALGIVALAFARRERRRRQVRLGAGGTGRSGIATTGWLLGALGLCLAASGVVALAVYGLLEYAGSR